MAQEAPPQISEKYIVWIDLEMTGLDLATDVILEIATIITDNNLAIIARGPSLVIHQPDAVLENMNSWCKEHHGKSGLTEAVKQSKMSLQEAEAQTLEFIKSYCKQATAPLAGNSVYQDRAFLVRYMPTLIDYLHYRIIDVSTVKELARRWYPNDPLVNFKKQETHRALTDIEESIKELDHYRQNFFKRSTI
jgi:oligoribonuclease